MYRAITWLALQQAIPMDDIGALGALAHQTPMELKGPDSAQVVAGGRTLDRELREAQVERHVSLVAQVPEVRRALVALQRRRAAAGKLVMVGRDIGTVVLPDADLKVFMSASAGERARRRWRELKERGQETAYQQVLEEIQARDTIDSQRSLSPLIAAADARLLDTEGLDVDQVVERILDLVRAACGGRGDA
jgi:cytidylate kinase